MPDAFILLFIIEALLVVYLCVSIGRRYLAEVAEQRTRERKWQCRAFQISSISDPIQQLRRDYITLAHARSHDTCVRRRRLAGARQTVTHRSFFIGRTQNISAAREAETTSSTPL
jgi:hypothetical protein